MDSSLKWIPHWKAFHLHNSITPENFNVAVTPIQLLRSGALRNWVLAQQKRFTADFIVCDCSQCRSSSFLLRHFVNFLPAFHRHKKCYGKKVCHHMHEKRENQYLIKPIIRISCGGSDKNVGPLTSSGDFQLITIRIDLNRRRVQSNCTNLRPSRRDKGAPASASFNYQLIESLRN